MTDDGEVGCGMVLFIVIVLIVTVIASAGLVTATVHGVIDLARYARTILRWAIQ